jgi:hypothetical protein
VGEDKVGMLPSSEFEASAICVEPEGHRISCDSLPIHYGHLIVEHGILLRWSFT